MSTLIFGALIYVSGYREFVAAVSQADPRFVALAVLSGCFTLFIWSVVWSRFFHLLGLDVRFDRCLRLLLAGTFLNAVTPLGRVGGQPFVAHLVGRWEEDSTYQQALSAVSSADISNAFPFITLGMVSVVYMLYHQGLTGSAVKMTALFTVLVLMVVSMAYLLWFGGARAVAASVDAILSFERSFGRWDPYIRAGKDRGAELLARLQEVGQHPRSVSLTMIISHLAVTGQIGAAYLVLLAVGIDPVLHRVVLVVALSAFLTFSPTPGSAGAFEAGFAGLVAAFFSVGMPTAVSVAVLYRIATYLPGVVLGYIGLLSLHGSDGA